ncbi:hypothetical protein B0H19DRAFT_1318957 [Mycena capillaripes]|nr:hypothetical protein B0H19DRAFT_1318957 [Mycena capillaripes]
MITESNSELGWFRRDTGCRRADLAVHSAQAEKSAEKLDNSNPSANTAPPRFRKDDPKVDVKAEVDRGRLLVTLVTDPDTPPKIVQGQEITLDDFTPVHDAGNGKHTSELSENTLLELQGCPTTIYNSIRSFCGEYSKNSDSIDSSRLESTLSDFWTGSRVESSGSGFEVDFWSRDSTFRVAATLARTKAKNQITENSNGKVQKDKKEARHSADVFVWYPLQNRVHILTALGQPLYSMLSPES